MLLIGQLFIVGFVYGFIVKPIIDAKQYSEDLNDLIASYENTGSR